MSPLDFLIGQFQEAPVPPGTRRAISVPTQGNRALTAIGMRRSGKTWFMYQLVRDLLESGVDKRDILYVNFEDDRLPIGASDLLADLLETFFRSNPAARERGAHLFLDEVQQVSGWARFVRRVLDTENARVVLSGSSAKLLSAEIATELRGRGWTVEVFPFSYAESLSAHGLQVAQVDPPGPRQRSQMAAHLEKYLRIGGFPEVQTMAAPERIQTLQDYVGLVVVRDVIERHNVSNVPAVKAFTRLLLQSPARMFSVNKAFGDLRSRGLAVSKDLLYGLLDHLQDAYLVFTIPVFRKSIRSQATRPRKLYAIDPGLAAAMSHVTATDIGGRLENAVFLELRRRHGRMLQGLISYYVTASGREVDFIVGDVFEQRATGLVQVCATLAQAATRDREVAALHEAMAETGVREAEIVTLNDEETIKTDAGTIHVVPAWRWLVKGSGRWIPSGPDEREFDSGGVTWTRDELHER